MSEPSKKTYLHNEEEPRAVTRTQRRNSHRHRRRVKASQPIESPSLELDVIVQPTKPMHLGTPFEVSVMISLKFSSTVGNTTATNFDTNGMFASATLVTDSDDGNPIPLPNGLLAGQTMANCIHPVPDDLASAIDQGHPCRVVLGYTTFPNLYIRQVGIYRVRTGLGQIGITGMRVIDTTDTAPINVERPLLTQVHHQRQL